MAALSELTVNVRQVREGSVALQLAQQFSASADQFAGDELFDRLRTGGTLGAGPSDLVLQGRTRPSETAPAAGAHVREGTACRQRDIPSDVPFASGFDTLHGIGQATARELDAFQILSPYRAGYFGADELNRQIQGLLRAELLQQWRETLGKVSGRRYVRHDKVLQTQNKRLRARERKAWDRDTRTMSICSLQTANWVSSIR